MTLIGQHTCELPARPVSMSQVWHDSINNVIVLISSACLNWQGEVIHFHCVCVCFSAWLQMHVVIPYFNHKSMCVTCVCERDVVCVVSVRAIQMFQLPLEMWEVTHILTISTIKTKTMFERSVLFPYYFRYVKIIYRMLKWKPCGHS